LEEENSGSFRRVRSGGNPWTPLSLLLASLLFGITTPEVPRRRRQQSFNCVPLAGALTSAPFVNMYR
jgi:hypothetical protein